MAKTNLLNTRTTNLMELLSNGRVYRVPQYQRDYSWEEEQWDDLWNDILELRSRSHERHYTGALVVEAKTDREFQIIRWPAADLRPLVFSLSLLLIS